MNTFLLVIGWVIGIVIVLAINLALLAASVWVIVLVLQAMEVL